MGLGCAHAELYQQAGEAVEPASAPESRQAWARLHSSVVGNLTIQVVPKLNGDHQVQRAKGG
jgi:hypothetical protein